MLIFFLGAGSGLTRIKKSAMYYLGQTSNPKDRPQKPCMKESPLQTLTVRHARRRYHTVRSYIMHTHRIHYCTKPNAQNQRNYIPRGVEKLRLCPHCLRQRKGARTQPITKYEFEPVAIMTRNMATSALDPLIQVKNFLRFAVIVSHRPKIIK